PVGGFSVRPGGSCPEASDQVRPPPPPAALKPREYGLPLVAGGAELVVIASAATTSTVNKRCDFPGTHHGCSGGSWSLSSSQNDQLPARLGIPVSRPSSRSERPGGSEPLRTWNWYGNSGPQPPSPSNWWLYSSPTVPTGTTKLSSVKRIADALGTSSSASAAA